MYFFQSQVGQDQLHGRASGSTVVGIRQAELLKLEIPCPPMPEQVVIGEILSNLDAKILANESMSKNLEELARIMFKAWFIDFDPVHSKMAGEAPVGLDSSSAALFPDSLEESELGAIPKGWRVGELSELADSIIDGDWIESKDQSDAGYRLIQIGNVGLGKFTESGKKRYVSEETYSRLRCTKIEVGDILVARMPDPTGRSWYVDSLQEPSITSVDVAIIKPGTMKNTGRYINLFINFPKTLQLMESLQTGSTRQRIKRTYIESLKIVIPPAPILDRFNQTVDALFSYRDSLQQEVRDLSQTRDALLPRLINGDLLIPREMLRP
jgi:type I restriction enzyme S subunit